MSQSEVIELGEGLLIVPGDGRKYRYRVIEHPNGEWRALLRDDGYRIYSIHIGENPINPPRGEREWELLWEYKHSEGPLYRQVVNLIMTGDAGKDME